MCRIKLGVSLLRASYRVQEIPLRSDVFAYRQTTTLSGRVYELEFSFNSFSKIWHMSIFSSDGGVIATGIPMVFDYPLTLSLRGRVDGVPDGQFFIIKGTDRKNKDVNVMGQDIKLLYAEEN